MGFHGLGHGRRHGHRYGPRPMLRGDEGRRPLPGSSSIGGRALRPKPILWVLVVIALALWSGLAWLALALADPALGLVATASGLVLDGSKDIATIAGAGGGVGNALDSLGASGFWGQVVAWLHLVLEPAILVVWAIGALLLAAGPLVLPRIAGLVGRRRH